VTPIRTFGIRPKDESEHVDLRNQIDVLFVERGENNKVKEFALDLCRDSNPVQVVFARISPGSTLQDTLSSLEKKIAANDRSEDDTRFGSNDVLLVPDIAYRLIHDFSELRQRDFQNTELAGQRIDVAEQEIMFRLDRSGAELISEMKMFMASAPAHFVADGPFLIYLKNRGASMPYFAMWIDNDELLRNWNG